MDRNVMDDALIQAYEIYSNAYKDVHPSCNEDETEGSFVVCVATAAKMEINREQELFLMSSLPEARVLRAKMLKGISSAVTECIK